MHNKALYSLLIAYKMLCRRLRSNLLGPSYTIRTVQYVSQYTLTDTYFAEPVRAIRVAVMKMWLLPGASRRGRDACSKQLWLLMSAVSYCHPNATCFRIRQEAQFGRPAAPEYWTQSILQSQNGVRTVISHLRARKRTGNLLRARIVRTYRRAGAVRYEYVV